jgi:hypothetical protein
MCRPDRFLSSCPAFLPPPTTLRWRSGRGADTADVSGCRGLVRVSSRRSDFYRLPRSSPGSRREHGGAIGDRAFAGWSCVRPADRTPSCPAEPRPVRARCLIEPVRAGFLSAPPPRAAVACALALRKAARPVRRAPPTRRGGLDGQGGAPATRSAWRADAGGCAVLDHGSKLNQRGCAYEVDIIVSARTASPARSRARRPLCRAECIRRQIGGGTRWRARRQHVQPRVYVSPGHRDGAATRACLRFLSRRMSGAIRERDHAGARTRVCSRRAVPHDGRARCPTSG